MPQHPARPATIPGIRDPHLFKEACDRRELLRQRIADTSHDTSLSDDHEEIQWLTIAISRAPFQLGSEGQVLPKPWTPTAADVHTADAVVVDLI